MNPSMQTTIEMTTLGTGIDRRHLKPVSKPNLHLAERNETARITRELHEMLFPVFAGAFMLLRDVAETMPARSAYTGPLGNALRVVRRVFEEGRAVLQGSQTPGFGPTSLEQDLSRFVEDFPFVKVRCEISVTGHRRELAPKLQEQIGLIAQEALENALRHSAATCIEAEVEYSPRRLRLVVRDNGRGIDPEAARARANAHSGLLGMRERAKSIGAKLTIWSKTGAGTEVEVSVPSQVRSL
jgi:signal transduction histidine kinase